LLDPLGLKLSEIKQIEEHQVVIGLGSNISPYKNLPQAIRLLEDSISILRISSVWRTQAIGSQGPDFLNAAVLGTTPLPISELTNNILRPIEESLARVRTADPNAPRTIDLDVIIFDGQIIDPGLWDYAHISVPVAELLPKFTNPVTGETLETIAEKLMQPPRIDKTELELH
jgi:2-amino-4-hydroxy-6-hydroxymethyldihydropteridine diphosphokinase